MLQCSEVVDTTNGFYRVYDFNISLSLQTKLYGYYIPIRKLFGDKVDRIRHVFTPSISFNYHPDFDNGGLNFILPTIRQLSTKAI